MSGFGGVDPDTLLPLGTIRTSGQGASLRHDFIADCQEIPPRYTEAWLRSTALSVLRDDRRISLLHPDPLLEEVRWYVRSRWRELTQNGGGKYVECGDADKEQS